MAPIPAILCGRNPEHAEHLAEHLAPKLQVIHACTNTEACLSEIPALLKGESVVPSSGLGSNAKGQVRTDPALVLIGAFPPQDLEAIKSAIQATRPTPVFVADLTKKSPGQQGPPSIDMIQQRMLESISAAEQGDGKFAPGVYMF